MTDNRYLEVPNVRRFVRFRVFFNARYYYPVFTILFLDYGLSLEAFSFLNILWAITIVAAEVPSGALADLIGRRNLLISGAVLMTFEMLVLLFAPINGGWITISLFALNRIASGLAEAMVSGADEALAFESLKEKGLESRWPDVLESTGKRLSLTMAGAMIIGAGIYDPTLINKFSHSIGSNWIIPGEWLIRAPIFLTLLHSIVVFWNAWTMTEPKHVTREKLSLKSIGNSFRQVASAAMWLCSARFVLFIILGGVILDSTARQFAILASEYYRQIQIPEFAFGILGAILAATGFINAKFAGYLVRKQTPFNSLLILSAILLVGLVGAQFLFPIVGLIFVPMMFMMFSVVAFLQSHYINREVESSQRATILSFRGLGANLGMALASVFYILLIARLKHAHAGIEGSQLQDTVFRESLRWFPGYCLALLILLLIAGKRWIRRREKCFEAA